MNLLPPSDPNRQGLSPILSLCSLLFIVLISYSNSLTSTDMLDDMRFIVEPTVLNNDLSWNSLRKVTQSPFGVGRALPMLTFAIDHAVGSSTPLQFHLTNIFIHLLATIAVFFFINALLRPPSGHPNFLQTIASPAMGALFVTALWALNPVQTNAVTYLVQRMTSLAALFYLTCLTLYLYGRRSQTTLRKILFLGGSAISAGLAFLSKENSATLPLMVLMVESFFITPGFFGNQLRRLKRWHWVAVAVIMFLLWPIVSVLFERHIMPGYQIRDFTLPQRLFTEPRVVVFYISLLLLPLPGRLNLEHEFSVSQSLFSPPTTFLSLLFLVGLLIAALRYRRPKPLVSFGICWFLLHLVIESSVIPLEIIFEHRLYLPSVGFFLVVIAFLDDLFVQSAHQKLVRNPQKFLFVLVTLLACLSATLTHRRNHDWHDRLGFYEDCLKKSPNKSRLRLNYGLHLLNKGRREEGVAELHKSMALMGPLRKGYDLAANGLMMDLADSEEPQKAIAVGESSLKILLRHRLSPKAKNLKIFIGNLASIYQEQRLYQKALDTYRLGLRIDNIDQALIEGMEDLLDKARNDRQGRTVPGLNGGREGVEIMMATEMFAIKNYSRTREYLDHALSIRPDWTVATAIQKRIAQEAAVNSSQKEANTITLHLPFQTDWRYRYAVRFSDAIFNYYAPLQSLATWLLQQAGTIYPHDPFINLAQARGRLLSVSQGAEADAIISQALQQHPTSPPILEMAARYYLAHNLNPRATPYIRRLLELYPGHPNRNFFQRQLLALPSWQTPSP